MVITIVWADGREEETVGEDIAEDHLFLRVLWKRSEHERKPPTIRLIRRDQIRAVRTENRIILGDMKGDS